MREQTINKYSMPVADIYAKTAEALSTPAQRPFQKVYTSLNTMLEECYFVGASKFGHNFIA